MGPESLDTSRFHAVYSIKLESVVCASQFLLYLGAV